MDSWCGCVAGDDISGPLKHSFIHTGHADATGKLWGDPGLIDEYVLSSRCPPALNAVCAILKQQKLLVSILLVSNGFHNCCITLFGHIA